MHSVETLNCDLLEASENAYYMILFCDAEQWQGALAPSQLRDQEGNWYCHVFIVLDGFAQL